MKSSTSKTKHSDMFLHTGVFRHHKRRDLLPPAKIRCEGAKPAKRIQSLRLFAMRFPLESYTSNDEIITTPNVRASQDDLLVPCSRI